MRTDGANSTNGTENWPADTEIDAVETQYGANYVSVRSGSVSASSGSTGDWTTEPQGWEPARASYATPTSTSESPGRTATTRTTRRGQQDPQRKISST